MVIGDFLIPFLLVLAGVIYAYWRGLQDGYVQGREDGWNAAYDSERKP